MNQTSIPPRRRWFQLTATAAALFIVGTAYCAGGLLMYRQRRTDGYFGESIWHSDGLIFVLPAVAAIVVNSLISICGIRPGWPLWSKAIMAFVFSIALTVLEFWLYMAVAVNRYGV
jgi:hypothetical protein